MKHGILVSLTIASWLPVCAFAQTYEKNDNPCIAELCIGDGLSEIAKVPWDRARIPGVVIRGQPSYVDPKRVDSYALRQVQDLYRGTLAPAAAYLADGAFDGKAVPALRGVTAACGYKELWGQFTTPSGNPTLVKIALVPEDHNTPMQRWTVTQISQKFPAVKSAMQRADATQQLNERYAGFRRDRPSHGAVKGLFEINNDPLTGLGFGFALGRAPSPGKYERLQMHPACGGASKVSID